MPGAPDISVVIPTRGRDGVIRRTLAALAEQELGGVEAEVIVVDNGSPEGSIPADGAFRLVRESAPGAAAARNAGIAAAEGRVVLFVGDDCVPVGRDFVCGHALAHDDGGAPRAVVGRIDWDPAVERTEVMDWLERAGHITDMARLEREAPGPETFYTGNVSVPRAALLDVAGFDQRFSGYGFEDLDLALRLADRGVGFEHRPDLAVHHSHRHTLEDSIRRMEAVGRGARLLHTLHDHRRPLPGPPAGRRRLLLGRACAGVPALVPRDLRFRALHLAAFARGYGAEALPDDPALRGYGALPRASSGPRPPVSVVVPFLGSRREGEELLEALARLRLERGDELIVVDNGGTLAGVPAESGTAAPGAATPLGSAAPAARILRAGAERSSYHARNAGADAAGCDWLLLLDADCRPPATLLDDYFREPVDDHCGIVAGSVRAARGQRALVARYAASRRHLSQAAHIRDPHRPYGITANLLVRRVAWADVGGFFEGLRSGGDQDLCWRIQDAGWTLAYREPAAVEHLHRERIVPLLRQMARYSAAIAWMARRAPGSSPRPRVLARLARSIAGAAAWLVAGRRERAAFKALDGAVVLAEGAGYLLSNDAPAGGADSGGMATKIRTTTDCAPAGGADSPELFRSIRTTVVDEWPTAAAAELARAGAATRIEAARRPERPDRAAAGDLRARYAEDDGILRRLAALLILTALAPQRAKPALAWNAGPAALRARRAGAKTIAGTGAHADAVATLLGTPRADAAEPAEPREQAVGARP